MRPLKHKPRYRYLPTLGVWKLMNHYGRMLQLRGYPRTIRVLIL